MLLNRALILAVFVAANPALGAPPDSNQTSLQTSGSHTGADAGQTAPDPASLTPRQAYPKAAFVAKPAGESQLAIKFRDDVRARAQADKRIVLNTAIDSKQLDSLNAIISRYNLKFVPAIPMAESRLNALTNKAAVMSGKAQPDLAGMMFIEANESVLQDAANALQKLDCVELVYFKVPWRAIGPPQIGACCNAGICTEGVTIIDCLAGGGTFLGPGELCTPGVCDVAACCLPDGNCQEVIEAQCDADGGTFQPGQVCLVIVCPQPEDPGACCVFLPSLGWQCQTETPTSCAKLDGVFTGGDCEGDSCQLDCGDDELADCFTIHPYPFCDDNDCCELIGGHRPICVDEVFGEWDVVCVALANILCDTPPADRCASPLNTGCFEPHGTGGCLDPECCNAVCAVDPFCCLGFWDGGCVDLARELCQGGSDDETPDFCALQGYLRPSIYPVQQDGLPADLPFPAPDFDGFDGEGMSLFNENGRLCDDVNMDAPQRYTGLYGLGRQLNEVYGVGQSNLARGAGIKVAVIEWAYFGREPFVDDNDNNQWDPGESFNDINNNGVFDIGHEDLVVTPEPNQTLVMIPSATSPEHATACLGVINGQENGFGVTGVAPDADAYFFPLTSIEEGPREFAAFINCFETLGPGDVVSCSFGPGNPYFNLNNEPFGNAMLGLGSSLGITVCVAAANDCQNLDELAVPDLGDSGAIVVGASTPGFPHCRIFFSNYYRTAGPASSRRVHCSAWGELVASTGGGGDLFFGDGDPNRSYTSTFNGTSAATPQVAGVAACLQGLAKQFYGIPLTPAQIRAAIVGGGFPQCGIGNPANLPGFDPVSPCGSDINPDFEGNRIGPYVQPRASGDSLLTQTPLGFDQSPLLQDAYILRGNLAYGNKFSLKGSDNSYLILQSLYTDRNFVPNVLLHLPEANNIAPQVRYYATGYTADLFVRARIDGKRIDMIVAGEVSSSAPVSLLFYEMYDWVLHRWVFVAFDQLAQTAPGQETPIGHFIPNPQRFISPSKNAYIRLYLLVVGNSSISTGGLSNNATPLVGPTIRFDWIGITADPSVGGIFGIE